MLRYKRAADVSVRNDASCVYCRNPNSDSSGPWCYTDGLGEKESCHAQIPKCGEYNEW